MEVVWALSDGYGIDYGAAGDFGGDGGVADGGKSNDDRGL